MSAFVPNAANLLAEMRWEKSAAELQAIGKTTALGDRLYAAALDLSS